jgi:hypothetical protein
LLPDQYSIAPAHRSENHKIYPYLKDRNAQHGEKTTEIPPPREKVKDVRLSASVPSAEAGILARPAVITTGPGIPVSHQREQFDSKEATWFLWHIDEKSTENEADSMSVELQDELAHQLVEHMSTSQLA